MSTRTKPITLQMLTDVGACEEQRSLFQSLFGQSVTPTRAIARRVAQRFNWGWAARRLLSASALKAYNAAVASALKAYTEAVAPAWKAFSEACAVAPAWKAYEEADTSARKAYAEAVAPAWKAYTEACAVAFLEAWRTQK